MKVNTLLTSLQFTLQEKYINSNFHISNKFIEEKEKSLKPKSSFKIFKTYINSKENKLLNENSHVGNEKYKLFSDNRREEYYMWHYNLFLILYNPYTSKFNFWIYTFNNIKMRKFIKYHPLLDISKKKAFDAFCSNNNSLTVTIIACFVAIYSVIMTRNNKVLSMKAYQSNVMKVFITSFVLLVFFNNRELNYIKNNLEKELFNEYGNIGNNGYIIIDRYFNKRL